MDAYESALSSAHEHALEWLRSLADRPVPPAASIDEVATALGRQLPADPSDPSEVVELLARAAEPGLTAMPSGRFFGFVIGGTLPAAMAADWLTSAWDQNCGLRMVTPAHSAIEDVTSAWLLDVLGLPPDSAVGYVTGATMSNFTCLAAARDDVLRRAGWDVARQGLAGSPGVRVLVGAERHDTIDKALRMLGLGQPELVAVDSQGRIDPEALADALAAEQPGPGRPTIVALQAGNVHSGAFDPFPATIAAARAHGAWVHVDGAFGLFAGASPTYRELVRGVELAHSWTTDAHKTLNVPYDSGIAIVRDPSAVRASMGMHGDYLIRDETGDPLERVPELSRRARVIPVWAALRSLGRSGVVDLIDRMCGHASAMARGIEAIPGAQVLNDVVYTQVCASFGSDARTEEVTRRLLADGTTWMSGSRWSGRSILRISVSNWSTTDDDVQRSLAALRRVVAQVDSGEGRRGSGSG